MRRAAVVLVLVAVALALVTEARAAQLGIVGEGLTFLRKRVWRFVALTFGAAVLLGLFLPFGPALFAAVAAPLLFQLAKSSGALNVFQNIGILPRLSRAAEDGSCEGGGTGFGGVCLKMTYGE